MGVDVLLAVFGAVGLMAGAAAGFLLGGRRRRVLVLVLAGIAAWIAWTSSWYGVGCSPNAYECTPALVAIVTGAAGLAALLGWVVGLGVGLAGRRRSRGRR